MKTLTIAVGLMLSACGAGIEQAQVGAYHEVCVGGHALVTGDAHGLYEINCPGPSGCTHSYVEVDGGPRGLNCDLGTP